MRNLILAIICGLVFVSYSAMAEKSARPQIKETVTSPELQFELSVDPKEKEVVIIPLSNKKFDSPPQLRLMMITKSAQSNPVEVKMISIPEAGGPRYAGKLDIWNDSYIGVEIRFSFDRKKWKSIRHEFSPR